MLKFYPSNRTENLAFIIAEIMRREPLKKVFDQEKIIIQSYGMGTWLQQQVSDELGVAAMVDCVMPASFIWGLADALLPKQFQVQGFEKQNLRWQIFELLPDKLAEPAYQRLKGYVNKVSPDNTPIARSELGASVLEREKQKNSASVMFDLASAIADIFDGYQNYRPEWLQEWEDGRLIQNLYIGEDKRAYTSDNFLEIESWQSDLWRSVYPDLPVQERQHRSSLLARLESNIRSLEKGSPLALPERIFVFGLSALPPRMLSVVKALAEHIDIHVVVNNPCRYYWGDVMSEHQQLLLSQSLLACGVSAETLADNFIEQNALLASWGKLGRDYMSLLMREEIFADSMSELFDDIGSQSASSLQLIQSDILNLRNQHHIVSKDDGSLSFASCHSPLREVEALHDYLLHTLDDNLELEARDIIVMVPDIEEYAAYIEAVFSRPALDRHGQSHTLPYVIADQALNSYQPLLECIGNLLALDSSRVTSAELLDWLDFPAIRQRFDIDEEELETIHHWVTSLNVRWGLSEVHRDQLLGFKGSGEENTWLAAIQRLLSGYILGNMQVGELGGRQVIPSEIFGADQQVLVGKLARFIDVVESTLCLQRGNKLPMASLAIVADIWEQWLDQESLHESVSQAMAKSLSSLSEEFGVSGYQQELPFSIVAQQVRSVLEEEKVSQRFLSGRINFCTLMPMRSVPFSVVCLLGMNEGKYPRPENKPSFDLMARTPGRVGDRSRRDDDRYLFLEALLSARAYLYISYTGRNISDNSERFPSVLVSELQDYCRHYFQFEGSDISEDVIGTWTTQHRIQAFHIDYYRHRQESHSDNSSRLKKSYNMEWFALLNPQIDPRAVESNPIAEQQAALMTFAPLSQSVLQQIDMFSAPEENLAVPQAPEKIPSLSIEHLIKALTAPLKFYYQEKTGLKISNLGDELEESEPFSLDGLASYFLKQDILQKELTPENCSDAPVTVFDTWRFTGRLPRAPMDEVYYAQTKEEVSDLSVCLKRLGEQEVLSHHVDFVFNDIRIIGSIFLLGGSLFDFALSRNPASSFFPCWVKHVISNYLRHQSMEQGAEYLIKGESKLVTADRIICFPALDKAESHRYMGQLLDLFAECEQQATPFLHKTAFSWIFEGESKAQKTFRGVNLGTKVIQGEMDDPYWQRYCHFSNLSQVQMMPDFESSIIVSQVVAHKELFVFTDLQGEPQK